MQGPQQKFLSSNHHIIAAASPKPSLTGPSESNENDSGQEQTIPMLQSVKKTGALNHLVSPALSAAFEVASPRRKILVERNENSSDGHSHKTSNFVSKGSPNISIPSENLSRVILLCNSDFNGEEGGSTVADDPSTNYLPPRPNLLSLDPNRCEILNFQEKEGTEKLTSSCNVDKDEELEDKDVKDTSLSPGKESFEKQEMEEHLEKGVENTEDEGEDEEEEEIEERGWWCLRGVLEFMLILTAYSLSISYMCSVNSPAPATNSQVIWSLKNESCTIETSTMKLYDSGFLPGDYSHADKLEIDEGCILLIEKLGKEEMAQNNQVIFEDRKEDNASDEGAETKNESVDKIKSNFKKFALSIGTKYVQNEDGYDWEIEKEVDYSDEDNFVEIDGASETEVVGIEVESKIEILEHVSGPGTRENEDLCGYELEKKEYTFNQSQDLEISAKYGMKEFEDEKSSHLVHEVHETGYYDEVETEIKGWNTLTIIGVSLASVLLGSLAFLFGSDKARITSTEKSQSLLEPRECVVEESVTTVFPAIEEKVDICAIPSSDEASKVLSFQIHAPKVELIGELVIGEMNGSFRGCNSRKNQMIRSAENMNNLIQPAIASNRPSLPEMSTMNSDSHGSFDGENKITNEGRKNAGEAKVKVTPVRRSRRIGNRVSTMSP